MSGSRADANDQVVQRVCNTEESCACRLREAFGGCKGCRMTGKLGLRWTGMLQLLLSRSALERRGRRRSRK